MYTAILEYTVKHRVFIIQNMYATKRVNQLYSTSEPEILNTKAAPPALVPLNINFVFIKPLNWLGCSKVQVLGNDFFSFWSLIVNTKLLFFVYNILLTCTAGLPSSLRTCFDLLGLYILLYTLRSYHTYTLYITSEIHIYYTYV